MPLATFKDLCLDAVDRDAALRFWSAVLGGPAQVRDDSVAQILDPDLHTVWINTVTEPKVVKNRVHLDLRAPSVEPLLALGATGYDEQGSFVVLRDPVGNEFCVFGADDDGRTDSGPGWPVRSPCASTARRPRRPRGGGRASSAARSSTGPTARRAGCAAEPDWAT